MSRESLTELLEAVEKEQSAINAVLEQYIKEIPPLARPIAEHVLLAGGKRLRPVLCLLIGRALGCWSDNLYTLGVAIEMLHAATLLHDDILDNAQERRKKVAAHLIFPGHDVILAGDALLAKSLLVVSQLGNAQMTACISEAVMQTAEGELAEFAHQRDINVSYEQYIEIITGKTAWMLRAPCELAALEAKAKDELIDAAKCFGLNIGIAFQIVDDAIDFSPSAQTGKPTGGDLREGKLTPPLFLYLHSLAREERKMIQEKIQEASLTEEEVALISEAIVQKGFANTTRGLAEEYLSRAGKALALFPDSAEKKLLEQMMTYVRTRSQ